MSDAAEMKADASAPDTEEKSDVQLEPTQEEMERERLSTKAEQVTSIQRMFGLQCLSLLQDKKAFY